MQKRLVFLIFIPLLTGILFAGTYSGGSGTSGDPYQIANLNDLQELQNTSADWGANFIQTADIDASATSTWDSGAGFSPIGISTNRFTGVYNGQNYNIDGLFINRPSTSLIGLFGTTTGATIENLSLTNVNIIGYDSIGGIAGEIRDSSTIDNCSSTGTVNGREFVGGLLGTNWESSTVSNSFSTVTVIGSNNSIGGLVGYGYRGNISNCYSTGTISGNSSVGGLLGDHRWFGTVENCYSTGAVTGQSNVGGLVGYLYHYAAIITSYSTGGVTLSGGGGGGLAGYSDDHSVIQNCYAIGDVTRTSGTFTHIGAFCGFQRGAFSEISNCYSTGDVSYTGATDPTDKGFLGQWVSGATSDNFWDSEASNQTTAINATAKTTAEMKNVATFTDETTVGLTTAWDFETNPYDDVANEQIWDMNIDYCDPANSDYPILSWQNGSVVAMAPQFGGSGTSGDPYQVSTFEDLLWISNNPSSWSSYFEQTADIDASASSTCDGGAGFSPIGSATTNFTGSYDGQDHTIDGLYINRPSTDEIGLFGYIYGSTMENIFLTNVNITGQNRTGGLTGNLRISSTMENCSSEGMVSGGNAVGGLVGLSYETCTIRDCYSTATVDGSDRVGGLIGHHGDYSIVENCYSTGTVNGGSYIGGLVGYCYQYAEVNTCYSTGAVTGTENAGGLVGYGRLHIRIRNSYSLGDVTRASGTYTTFGAFCGARELTLQGEIINCYSTGDVSYTGATDPTDKGFIGQGSEGTILNNFWDSEASNQTTAIGATAKTTAEMKTLATFTDYTDGSDGLNTPVWDFETNPYDDVANEQIWDMDLVGLLPKVGVLAKPTAFINDGYPFLAWENGDDVALPVELSYFTASATLAGVELKWRTESEIENLGYILERKKEGTDFVEIASYKTDSNLEGQGTTSSATDYSYTDDLVEANTTYEYRLADVDHNGVVTYHSTRTVKVENAPLGKVEKFTVLPAYPNPFNPSTTIRYGITTDSNVNISIYDITGKLIATLLNTEQTPGWHSITWVGTNQHGEQVPAGVYLSRVKFGNKVKTNKLMLLK